MQNYHNLQKLYSVDEIKESCVEIDFAYAFICAMASSELELEQWMPLLFLSGESHFSNEKLASEFAQIVLAIYQQAGDNFQENVPLVLTIESSMSPMAIENFANGYLQALLMIDNMQILHFAEDSLAANLQQTCLLLLDKLVSVETTDIQKLQMFEQLPSRSEIMTLLPSLLSGYGHQCLLAKEQ